MAKAKFLDTNIGKTLKTALYLGLSAVIAGLITASADDPQLFGPITAIVNLALVLIKQSFFTPKTPNLGA